jgi:hypothetical protein
MSDKKIALEQATERHSNGMILIHTRKTWECQQCGYASPEEEEVREHECGCELCYEGNCPHSCHSRFMEE